MPYKATNTKKFLDSRGLTYFSQQLNNYPDNTVIEAVVEGVQDALDEKLDAAQKGAANGVAPLDATQKVPLANLSVMTGATNSAAGTSGLVPSSNAGDQNKFLKASGEWGIPAGTSIHQFVLDDMTNATGSYSHSTSLSAARATMKAVNIECSNPDAFLDAITITINNGSILLECNKVNGSSSILVTAVEGQTGEQLTVSQYAELVGKIGDITSLTTVNKDSLTAAVNEIDSVQNTISSQVTNKIDKPVNVPEGKFLQTDSNGNAVWGAAASPTDVANAVTDWLDDNIPAGQTVTVDQSLTVSGAAADAKKTGDKITDLKSALNNISELQNLFVSSDATDDKRLTSDGGAMSATGYFISDYIPVEPGCYYEKNSPTIDIYHRACFYNSSKTFIANSSVNDSNIMQAPQYGHYVRFCGLMTEKSTADIHLVSAKDEVARLIAKEAFLGLKYSMITDATTYTDADYVPVNSVIAFANETAGSIAHLPGQIGTLITMSYGTTNNANYEVQFFFKTDGNMCTRYKIGGSWKAWTEYMNQNDSIIYDRAMGQVLNDELFTVGWAVNKYIDSDTGEVKPTSGSTSVSDKIMIPDTASLSVACPQCQIATYSADGAFIARTGYNHGVVISSANAKYIRIQYASADTSVINANVGLRIVYSDDLVHESELGFVAENMVQTTVNGTGNPLVLNGTSEKEFESFSITGNAARNVTICGKNIFKLNEQSTITSNGVTFEFDNAAGQISVTSETGATGTAKSAETFENGNFNFTFPVDTYVSISDNCSQHLLFDSLIQLRVWDYVNEKFYSVASGGVSFLASANTKYSVYILVREGWSGSVTFRPQVEIGTHVTARELYNGVTVNVPAGSGSEILSANAFKYADSGNNVKASYQDVDNTLFVEADGEQTSVVLVADRNNVVTIGGVDYYCIDSFTGISGAVCLSGIPKKYGGAIRAQITDGLISYYDYGSGVIFNADSSKTYVVRVMLNAYTKIRDAIKLSVSTGVLALSHYHSCKGTTTIYTNNSDFITATAVTTTMQENAVSSIATLKSISLLTGGKEKNLLNKLKRYPPLVSFIDDDTTSIAYVKRYHDVFANNNAVGSYAVKTDTVDANTGLLDLLLDYEEEGFGMLYHCYQQNGDQTRYWIKGDSTYDEDKIRENYFTGLRRIAQYGFANYKYWVTPYGVNDGFIVDLAKNTGMQCLFNCPSSTFDQYGYVSPSANCSRWDIPRLGLTQNTDMSKLQKVTDACAADKGWLIVVTHANSWGEYDMETRLGNYIQYCKSSGFKIVPPAVGFETFRSVFDVYDLT